jgi:membrane associated rhomboid family serine protease
MPRVYNGFGRRNSRNFFEFMGDWFDGLSMVGWLIFVNIVVSIIAFIAFAIDINHIDYFALKPSSILLGNYLWTLVVHMFVHGGFMHLVINMFVLFSLGNLCEKIIGRKRFFWFYLVSGLFAGLLSVFLAGIFGFGFWERVFGSPEVYMVGASGAIFAIAGLFVMLLPRLKFMIIFLPFFSLPAFVMVPLILVLTWIASIAGGLPIGNVAHFGGFLAGVGYGWYLRNKYPKKISYLGKMFR